jgi:thiol-disulfide isomerase/thioredoxin
MKQENTVLTLYYREGCHLCEQMAAALYALQEELHYQVEWIDIDKDKQLKQRYNVDIPVLAIRDEVIFYHFFDEISLRQAIEQTTDNKPLS